MAILDSMIDSLDPLTKALHERGFELFVAVRVAAPIQNKINVIKEVRVLTGIGLKAAKDAVEQEQIILDALAPGQAERVSERLAAAGGHSALLLARGHLYAYVPNHMRRGAQTCERLTVKGHTLELSVGELGQWWRTEPLPVDDGELLAAIDRQRASWAAAGCCEAGSEIEILRRVSARNEQLEAAIRAAEGEALAHEAAVYSDWLQGEGDGRGYVGTCVLNVDAATDDDERGDRGSMLDAVVLEFEPHLFGPARALFERGCMELEWIGPMIGKLKLADEISSEYVPLLERVLALPVCAGLRTLEIEPSFSQNPDLGELLARSSCAPSLRRLALRKASRVSFVDARFERLEELELSGSELGFGPLSVPALRRLKIEFPNPPQKLEPCFVGLDAPALEHLDFALYVYEFWDHHYGPLQSQLASLLELPAFARLRSLTLRSLGGEPYQLGLAQILARLPARRTLERIDLREAALVPQVRAELEAARSTLPELLLDS